MSASLPSHAVRLPAPALRPFISHYAGFHATGVSPGTHAGLPSRHVHLILSLAGPIEVLQTPGAGAPGAFAALVGGLQDSPAMVRQGGDMDGLHLFLKPSGVLALLGVSSGELTSRVVHLSDLWARDCELLRERLAETRTWEERFSILDDTFMRRLRPVHEAREMAWAWGRLALAHGLVPVQQVARELGYSRRHFGELFHAGYGVAPKTAARIFRFERACRMIMDERPGLAQVAAACGFHDQAHMTHEWNAMAGCAPLAWIAKELPNLQDYEVAGRDTGNDDRGRSVS